MRKTSRHKARSVVIVLSQAGLAALNRNTRFGVGAWHVGGKIQVEDLGGERPFVGGRGGWPHFQNFEGPGPVQGEFDFQNRGVSIGGGSSAWFGALFDGSC